MTKLVAALVALAIVFVAALALTNPDEADFYHWYEARLAETSAGTRGLTGIVARAKETALSVSARATLERKSYVFFTVYRIRALDKRESYLGLLGHFIPLGSGA
jgi:hypothetical protein